MARNVEEIETAFASEIAAARAQADPAEASARVKRGLLLRKRLCWRPNI